MVCLEFWGDENHIKEGNMDLENAKISESAAMWNYCSRTSKLKKDEAQKVVEVSPKAHNLLGHWWYGCSKFQLAKYRLSYFGTTRCFESLSLQGTPSFHTNWWHVHSKDFKFDSCLTCHIFISHILQTPSGPQSFHKNLSRFLPLSTWHLFPIHDYTLQLSQAPLPEDPSTSWSPTSTWATQHCPACLSPTDHSQSTHKSLAPFPSLWRM